jgi:hypothetical protein
MKVRMDWFVALVVSCLLYTSMTSAVLAGTANACSMTPVNDACVFSPGGQNTGVGYGSRVNTPPWKTVNINMSHVLLNHTYTGAGYQQSGVKSAFPVVMSPAGIETAIRQAYRDATQLGSNQKSQKDGSNRILLEGKSADLPIQMWFNVTTKTIETAYPSLP